MASANYAGFSLFHEQWHARPLPRFPFPFHLPTEAMLLVCVSMRSAAGTRSLGVGSYREFPFEDGTDSDKADTANKVLN